MRYLYILLLLVGSQLLLAQDADSLDMKLIKPETADTTIVKPKHTFNRIVVKAAIDSLMEQNRTLQPFRQLSKLLFNYHSGYHFASQDREDIYFKDHGFTVRQTPFIIGYEVQKRIAFSNCIVDGRSISFEENPYTYPAALTNTEFGIGGQDMNYALLQIRKNELVGADSLYGRFNALFQRGFWGGQYDNSTMEDIFLKYALKNSNLQLHAQALDWDIPYFQHSWIFDEPGFATIREKSVMTSLYWNNHWLNAGFQVSHVNWMAPAISLNGKYNFWQILLDREIKISPLSIQLRYEHFNEQKIDTAYNQFITQSNLKDLGTVHADYQTKRYNLQSTLYASNPESIGYDNEWFYRFYKYTGFVLNVSGMKSFTHNNHISSNVQTILFNQTTGGVKLENKNQQSIGVDYGFKTKQIRIPEVTEKGYVKLDEQKPYFAFSADIPIKLNQWTFIINEKLETPYFQSILDINAHYQLPYDNRILFGFTHSFRDKSILDMGMDSSAIFSDAYENQDNLMDAYLGLQITKQFDIRFTVKNIFDQQVIFSQYLIPITYLLNIKWDFVN